MSAAANTQNNHAPLIDLDGRFGMHPMLKSFESFYREGRLAIVHGIGSPNNTRSHFDAQDYMESGTPSNKGTASGWLNRAAGLMAHDHISPFQAVSLTSALPRSFYGDTLCIAIANLQDFTLQLRGNPMSVHSASASFEELYDQTTPGLLRQTGRESFDALKLLRQSDIKNYQPAFQAVYPSTALGNALKQIAQLIKMDVGLEVAFAEHGGWDTHFNQGTAAGTFARNAADQAFRGESRGAVSCG